MPRTILKSLGLDPNEIRIYLTCLTAEALPIATISKKSGIKRTTLYGMMDKLAEKGFLTSHEEPGKGKLYSAVDPHSLVDVLKSKSTEFMHNANRMEAIAPSLQNLKGLGISDSGVKHYKGVGGLKNMIEDEFTNVEGEVLEISSGGVHYNKEVMELFENKISKSNCKKRDVNTNSSSYEPKVYRDYLASNPNLQVRFIEDKDYKPTISTIIKDDKVVFMSYKEQGAAVVTSKKIAENMKGIFEYLWKNGTDFRHL